MIPYIKNKYIVIISIFIVLSICSILLLLVKWGDSKEIYAVKLIKKNMVYSENYIFREKDNIKKIEALEKNLKNYEPIDNLMLAPENIELEILYNDGTKKEIQYEKIKPSSNYFNDILDTEEAKQSNYILYNSLSYMFSRINRIVLESSHIKEQYVIIEDKELMKKIINEIYDYYSSDRFLKEKMEESNFIEVRFDGISETYKIFKNNYKLINMLKENEICI